MQCPNCGQELSDQDTICPGCGQPLPISPPSSETAPASSDDAVSDTSASQEESAPEESSVPEKSAPECAEAVPNEADPLQDESEKAEDETLEDTAEKLTVSEKPLPESKPSGRKLSRLSVLLIVIIAVLVVAVICLVIALTADSDGSSSVREKAVDADAVAVTVTDADGNMIAEVTNGELSYYYWGEYYYYVQNYGYYFDYTQPLDEQSYSDDMTWEDYFLACACSSVQQIYALKEAAEADGYEMPEDYQSEYDETIDSMESFAVTAGFLNEDGSGDVLAYVQDSYGSAATVDSFAEYLYTSYYVTAYSDEIYLDPVYTDEEIEAYFDENSEMFTTYGIEKSDQPNVDVRHILITPADVDADEDADEEETAAAEEAAWDEALAKAEDILAEWKAGDATEESFAELAETYSEDSGSNTAGGLYESVYPGEMVTEFNDWCFDGSRKPGDTDIVKTSYGYHILYFVGFTDTYYWKTVAEGELRYEQYSDVLTSLIENYNVEVTQDLGILEPDAVSAMAEYAEG